MRLIDADAVRNALYDADAITMRGVAIINRSTTIDAVPVVRCKDCKHFAHCEEVEGVSWTGFCNYGEFHTDDEDFCSRGERRSDD